MKLLRKIVAILFRTFSADCPHCHGHFYGFQGHEKNIKINGTHYRIVCLKCARKHLKKGIVK